VMSVHGKFLFFLECSKIIPLCKAIRVECKKCQARGTCESDYNLYGVYKLVWWVFLISSLVRLRSVCFMICRVEFVG
jgi:hypothetical protein